MTFLPWARDDAHHSLTRWEMFRRYGVSFDPYDDDVDMEVGDTSSTNATTGITTLISQVSRESQSPQPASPPLPASACTASPFPFAGDDANRPMAVTMPR